MGERGPVSKPASLHLLHGNASKKPLSALLEDVLRVPVAVPGLPHHLRYSGAGPKIAIEARAEFERLAPHLEKLRLVSELDRAALVMYCFWWAVSVAAQEKIVELGEAALVDQTPSGYKQMGVWVQVAGRAGAELKTYLAQFGLSPAARSRVSLGEPQGALPGMEKPAVGGWDTFT